MMYWPDLEALFTVFDGLKWSRHEPTLSRHTREINVGPLEPRRLWREDGGVRVNIEHGVVTDKAYVGCCLTRVGNVFDFRSRAPCLQNIRSFQFCLT